MHRGTEPDPLLQFILSSKTSLSVKEAEEKEKIQPGIIYIAPGDYHLLIEKDHTFSLDFSEKVNFSRPSIDVTFSIAAEAYGATLACLLLSGANADGTEGLVIAKAAGGIAAVQDPATASVPFMPQHAISKMQPDYILPAGEIASFINNLS
jgi:two-component system chemotaxis response regulator CheB